jgi:hypothetical protein
MFYKSLQILKLIYMIVGKKHWKKRIDDEKKMEIMITVNIFANLNVVFHELSVWNVSCQTGQGREGRGGAGRGRAGQE